MSYPVRGFVTLLAVPFAVSRQVAWTVARELGADVRLPWGPQSLKPGFVQATVDWVGNASTGANLASALGGWNDLWFEVSQEPSEACDGSIWFCTPSLGITHRQIDSCGNIFVGEDQLRGLLQLKPKQVTVELERLLANDWLDELEPLRVSSVATRAVYLAG